MVGLLYIPAFPIFLAYSGFTGNPREGLKERLGFLGNGAAPFDQGLRIWLHAASVGEMRVAHALIPELRARLPGMQLLVSAMTKTGRTIAQEQLASDQPCIYAPLDFSRAVARTWRYFAPDVYICLETELWPNMLRQARRSGAKVILLNGRLSENSFRRYQLVRGFMREVLANFAALSVNQPIDAERYLALGADADKVVVQGNAKYDILPLETTPEIKKRYRMRLGLGVEQPIFVAGSTHPGEEEIVLRAWRQIRKKITNLILILAPRHLDRLAGVEVILREQGISFERLSAFPYGSASEVVLVDTMGDLAGLYSLATYAFCGGSLVPRGGHNLMEAAAWGVPVFYGPNTKDFADARDLLEAAGAGFLVTDARSLADQVLDFAGHPTRQVTAAQRARAIALGQSGAAGRQAELVCKVLAGRSGL